MGFEENEFSSFLPLGQGIRDLLSLSPKKHFFVLVLLPGKMFVLADQGFLLEPLSWS